MHACMHACMHVVRHVHVGMDIRVRMWLGICSCVQQLAMWRFAGPVMLAVRTIDCFLFPFPPPPLPIQLFFFVCNIVTCENVKRRVLHRPSIFVAPHASCVLCVYCLLRTLPHVSSPRTYARAAAFICNCTLCNDIALTRRRLRSTSRPCASSRWPRRPHAVWP